MLGGKRRRAFDTAEVAVRQEQGIWDTRPRRAQRVVSVILNRDLISASNQFDQAVKKSARHGIPAR